MKSSIRINRLAIIFAILSNCKAYGKLRKLDETINNSDNQDGDERKRENDNVDTLIIGGEDALKGVFENIVCDLTSPDGSSHYCACTMIAPDIALSAAHCYTKEETIGDYVEVGKYNIYQYSSSHKGNVERIRIIDVKLNRNCKNRWLCDVMVLKLEREYSKPLPIKLQLKQRKRRESDVLTVIGWGSGIPDNEYHMMKNLQKVELNYFSYEKCKPYYRTESLESYFCAYTPGKDSCSGDSGGPILRKKILKNGKVQYIQEGITSFGFIPCAIGPGVYSDLSYKLTSRFLNNSVCSKKIRLSPNSSYCRRGKLKNAV